MLIFRQELQGYPAAELGVFGLKHHAHASMTELAENSVMRDEFSVHCGKGMLTGGRERVNCALQTVRKKQCVF